MISFSELGREEARASIEQRLGVELTQHAVLGFDVYKYGGMTLVAQRLVPMILHPLRLGAVKAAFEKNRFIFQHYSDTDAINKRFIDTGDGGFFVLENPLEALIVLLYHATAFQGYNSWKVHSSAREITGELHLRYAITVGDCYCYRNNYYGGSIVNASRTLAKDQLNRILIDNKVHDWFSKYFMGIANLPNVTDSDLKKSSALPSYSAEYDNYDIFSDNPDAGRIISVSEMKLQQTASKMTALELYVLALQFELNATEQMTKKVRIALGNINTSGLD